MGHSPRQRSARSRYGARLGAAVGEGSRGGQARSSQHVCSEQDGDLRAKQEKRQRKMKSDDRG